MASNSESPGTGFASTVSRTASAFAAAAEAALLVALALCPWPFGAAVDWARYGLTGLAALGTALWLASAGMSSAGAPVTLLVAAALPALALVQIFAGRTAAPVATADALVVLAGMLGALAFWQTRARDRNAASRLAWVVLATTLAQAVFGVVQWSLGPSRIYGRATPIVTSPFGSYVNHNHFAGLVEMATLLAAGMAIGLSRRRKGVGPGALVLAGLTLGLATAHAASRSRGGLVALAAGFAVLGGLSWAGQKMRTGRSLVAAGAAGLVVLAFAIAAVPAPTRSHLRTLLRGRSEASGAYRVDMAVATLRLAAARPLLGWGIGAYEDAIPAFKVSHGEVRTSHAEADALELLGEAGALGAAAIGALAFMLAGGFEDRRRTGRDPFRAGIASGAAAAVVAVAVHSFFDFNLRIPANALVFASLAGLAGAPRSEPRMIGRRFLPALCAVLFAALAAAAIFRSLGALSLQAALGETSASARTRELDRVVARHAYLVEGWRARARAWRDLAATSPALRSDRLARSERDLVHALGLRPRWSEAWAELGWVRLAGGNLAGADAAFARAADLDPTHVGIGTARAEFLAWSGRIPEALAELSRLVGKADSCTPAWALRKAARWTDDPGRKH